MEMTQWYVLMVERGREIKACAGLAERVSGLGVQVYLPTELRMLMRRGKRVEDERALIPGYLFVGLQEGQGSPWAAIMGAPGVYRPICVNGSGEPSQVPRQAMDTLREVEEQLREDFDRRRARGRRRDADIIAALKEAAPGERGEVLLGMIGKVRGAVKLAELTAWI